MSECIGCLALHGISNVLTQQQAAVHYQSRPLCEECFYWATHNIPQWDHFRAQVKIHDGIRVSKWLSNTDGCEFL